MLCAQDLFGNLAWRYIVDACSARAKAGLLTDGTCMQRRKSSTGNVVEQGPLIPRGIIDPQADWCVQNCACTCMRRPPEPKSENPLHARRYSIWWGITIALSAFTGVYEPWVVAFLTHSER